MQRLKILFLDLKKISTRCTIQSFSTQNKSISQEGSLASTDIDLHIDFSSHAD